MNYKKMVIYIIVGFIAVCFCLFFREKKRGLQFAFVAISLFLSIRYMWGNDYAGYLQLFKDFNSYSFDLFDMVNSSDLQRHNEFGWVIINRLFGFTRTGFFGMVIVTSIFECWVVYHVFKKYVSPKYYWVAVLFWFFSTSFCVNASMMRQYLCMCIYFLVVDLMIEKKRRGYLWIAIILIVLGMTIHRSSIILFASLPLFYIHLNRIRTIWIVVFGGIFLLWQVYGQSLIEPYVSFFLESSEDYEEYMQYVGGEKTGLTSTGLGAVFRYVMFVVWLSLLPQFDKRHQPIIMLVLISYFFEVIGNIAPLANRLGFYFSFFNMICWAGLYEKAKQQPLLYLFFAVQLLIIIRSIPQFFFSPLWSSSYLQYHTIFSAPSWM